MSSPIVISDDESPGESVREVEATRMGDGEDIAHESELETGDSSRTAKDHGRSPVVIEIPDSPVKLVVSPPYSDVFKHLQKEDSSAPVKRELFSKKIHSEQLHPMAFESPPPKYPAESVLKRLLNPNIDRQRVCTTWPVSNINHNAAFVVDVTQLKHPDDVRKDYFGKWIHSGSHPFTFKASFTEEGEVSVEKCAPGATGSVFYLRRLHSYHPSNTDFRRMLAFVSDEHFNPHPLCLVVYYLPEGFIPTVVPHGNSKSNSPFFPTLPSTSKVIQENCLDLGPKAVVTHLESSAGGVVEAGYPGELPRNELQVSNYKRRVPVRVGEDLSVQSDRNELYTVMLQAHLEDGDKQFIRDVKAYPEPAIVLATEQQLHDLERFCCNPLNFSVLTVDPTFSLGDFDITPTTYRHLLLRSKRTDKPPVMLGPTLIHYRKTFSTYKFLASCMISLNRHLEGLRAFGTDGETPLIDAFAREFRCAVHVICFNHVRRNIKEKLHKLMIPDVVQSEILNDIFGWRVESTLLTGLVDSGSIPLFEQKLTHLQAKWKLHDVDDDQGPVTRFCTWFQTYKVEVIRDAMLPHVREQAGLGTPPDHFYTNTSESVNKVIKTKVDYKRNELLQFVNKLHDLVVEQQREAEKAVVGCGKYYIHCSDLEIPQSQWFTMSRDQRRQHLKKFNHAPVVSVVTEHPIPSASLENAAPQMRVGTSRSSESTSISSPVPLSEALSTKLCPLSGKLGLPAEAIAAIAKKAAEIIQTDGAIVNAPGQPGDAKMVISRSGKRPHLVVPKKKGGGLSCDDDCPQYKSAKLCSHVVAAAEYNKQLDRFVASYGTSKKVPKLTALTTAGMPKGRGRKGSKAPAKRRPSVPVQTRVELYPMTPGSTIGLNPSVQVHNVQVSAQQNASLTVSPLYQPTLTSPSTSTSVHPSSFPVPMSSYPPVPMSSYLPMPSTYPSMPISSPYLHMHSTPSLSGMDPTCGGMYPFRLHFISGNISVCNGCKGRYKKLPPPHDLCLQHEEWRTFTPQGSVSSQTRFGNTYYHCNVSCVFAVWPSFVPSSVVIPIEVQACLLPEHKQWLYVNFGVFP